VLKPAGEGRPTYGSVSPVSEEACAQVPFNCGAGMARRADEGDHAAIEGMKKWQARKFPAWARWLIALVLLGEVAYHFLLK